VLILTAECRLWHLGSLQSRIGISQVGIRSNARPRVQGALASAGTGALKPRRAITNSVPVAVWSVSLA
jgi:hypothetical protein